MATTVRGTARSSRIRESIASVIGPVLARYGLDPPRVIDVDDRFDYVRVRLVFACRVPGYARSELKAAVLGVLAPMTAYPAAATVAVVCA